MIGGVSHLESFDPKPELNKYAGKTIAETPYKATLESPYLKQEPPRGRRRPAQGPAEDLSACRSAISKRGQSGIEVSDWWPHVGDCVDDIAVVRSMWTTDNDHGAQLQFHTGRHVARRGISRRSAPGSTTASARSTTTCRSSSSSARRWPTAAAASAATAATTSGPSTTACACNVDPKNPLPFAAPGPDVFREEQRGEFDLLGRLNRPGRRRVSRRPGAAGPHQVVRAGLPHADGRAGGRASSTRKPPATQKLYGLDNDATRAVRPAVPGGAAAGRARRALRADLPRLQRRGRRLGRPRRPRSRPHAACAARSISRSPACSKDLKQRGLLDETLVVWGTEFGRTPGAEGADGRDHHPYGFSVWLAGGGIKGGIVHGATDELGFHAVENRHYVTDIHATVLHQLGLDPRSLEVPGRKRLEIDFGKPIAEIMA